MLANYSEHFTQKIPASNPTRWETQRIATAVMGSGACGESSSNGLLLRSRWHALGLIGWRLGRNSVCWAQSQGRKTQKSRRCGGPVRLAVYKKMTCWHKDKSQDVKVVTIHRQKFLRHFRKWLKSQAHGGTRGTSPVFTKLIRGFILRNMNRRQ